MKAVFNLPLIEVFAEHISAQSIKHKLEFDAGGFIELVANDFESLELKERSHRIFLGLSQHLAPSLYEQHVELLLSVLTPIENNQDLTQITTDISGVAGWMVMPMAEYIAQHALYDESRVPFALNALKELTRRFTAEFAIRHLLLSHPDICIKTMENWIESPCHHVRRLVSEGTRPKLPWASQLPLFITEPKYVLPLLERLKSDESEYVRRSVANHINDISKDHPELTVETLKEWANESNEINRLRLIKHAGRTLIKSGNPDMLAIIGFEPIDDSLGLSFELDKSRLKLGENLTMSLSVVNNSGSERALLVDYCVYHLRSRGQHIKKVFKWKSLVLKAGESQVLYKKHGFKVINTRRYYGGEHFVSVLINGQEFEQSAIELEV